MGLTALLLAAAASAAETTPFDRLKAAAERGAAKAQYELALAYAWGKDVPQDDVKADLAKALEWYRRAAAKDVPNAQFRIGLMYGQGLIRGGGAPESVVWLRKAAEQGLPDAQYNLGLMSYYGRGLTADFAEAFCWLTLASEAGADGAAALLAELSEKIPPAVRDKGLLLAGARRRPVPKMFKERLEPC